MTDIPQGDLFGRPAPVTPTLPEGFLYRENYITAEEEADLLAHFASLPFEEAQYRQWTARRRTMNYGGRYDFTHHELHDAEAIPPFLHWLRDRLAAWVGIDGNSFTHANIAEYRPGTQLGWHRDVPDFEIVAGTSLAGTARMRFRPYPPEQERARATAYIDLQPRSAYRIQGVARWGWQHAISPTRSLRYSITFRTLRIRNAQRS